MKLILLLCITTTTMAGTLWRAHLPGGTVATATPTSWGVSVSYDDYPSAASTSITGRTTYKVTTRTADAPLALSLMSGENWDWLTALDNHWVEFSATGLDGIVRAADFYPENYGGPIKAMMYSADGDSHAVPEPSAWAWLTIPLAVLACIRRLRRVG